METYRSWKGYVSLFSVLLALGWGALRPAHGAETLQVHLSIDDMPIMIERGEPMWPEQKVLSLNHKLLEALGSRSVSTSVFAVCDRLRAGDGMVAAWREGGHAVGNHSYSHAPLNRMEPAEWVADVRRCHQELATLSGAPPTWFRFPYLGHGRNAAAQAVAREGLEKMGYQNVPVTVATSEWVHAHAYRRALQAKDDALRAEVVADWHRHMDEALKFGRELAAVQPGREVVQVVLVHVNELVADEVGALIDRWKKAGVQFVDVETAMADPVFSMKNHYSSGGGISWLFRIQPERDPLKYWFGIEEGRLVERFGGAPKPQK
jgi:peptidoglycan-N-acetylglucosamine deacetylase